MMLRSMTSHTLCAVLGLALLTGTAFAHPRGRGAPYTVTVEDTSGRTLPTYHHGGRTYVLGHWGRRYNIRVENHTARRIEAVVSVDGRDVVSGRVGDYVQGRGYLVAPYGSIVIEGFRESLSRVAAFRFTDPSDSYSSRMGTPQHVGVIGVAVFPERRRHIARRRPRAQIRQEHSQLGTAGRARAGRPKRKNPNPRAMPPSAEREAPADASPEGGETGARAPRSEARASAPLADADVAPRRQNLGTRYGESRHSHVREVQFARANRRHPAQVITLRYDDRKGLLARGIDVDRRHRFSHRTPSPAPFPGSRFAPPPPPY